MITKNDLEDLVYEALQSLGGKGSIVDVAKYIWDNKKDELLASGDIFYTWQYDMRWAATELRKNKKMEASENSSNGEWKLL